MPSWSHNISQEHQWTNRKLIGDSDDSGDERKSSDPESMELAPTLETNGRHVKGGRRGSSSDNEKQTLSDVHREGFPTSFLHQNSFQHPLQSSQEGVGNPRSLKRTLLTTEEMAESDDDDVYDEGWEEGDVSEDEQMNQSWSSGNASPGPGYRPEIIQGDDGHDGTIDLRGQREVKNDSGSNRAGSGTILDTQSDHDEVETPNSTIDSGRVNSVDPTLAESSSSQVLAHKRRKKAIKYLEHIILDLLRQLVAITKLQLRQVRSEIGEGDASESESEKEELVENGVQKPSTVDETNVTGDEGGKGVPNVCIPLLNRATGNLKYLKYPGKAGQSDTSALSLARLLKVCELLHHALVEDIIVTKRDIYYKDVNLFGKQSVVDALIDDIVASIGLKRVDFNVVASPKGLVASSGLILLMKNDERKTVSATPTIIPSNGEIIEIQSVAPPRWALVIEKEATFTTLCKSGILADEELESGLLITGKGYPDLATLHFLKLLSESFPDCLIGILVDADPHGLDILSVYRYGSKKMRYTAEAEGLALGAKAEWLGVKATEWAQLNIDLDKLIPVSEKDIQFAQSMLQEDDLPLDWKRELVHMLHMRRKAEIQILGGISPTNRFDGKGFAGTQAKQSPKPPQESLTKSTSPPHEGFHQELNPKDAASSDDDRAESVESSKDVLSSDCRDRLYDYVKAKLCKMLYKTAKTDEEMHI